MLRDGPIPAAAHGVYEYLLGAALIAVPLLAPYHHGAAKAASIVLGVAAIVMAATTQGRTSLINEVPPAAHMLIDLLLAALLIASPFLFGFDHEGLPTAVFIAVGVAHLLVTIGTRFKPPDPLATRGGRRFGRRSRAAEPTIPVDGGTRGGAAAPAAEESRPAGPPGAV